MKFSKLAEYLLRLEKTSSRLGITAILSELFKNLDAQEIRKTVHLTLGQLAPKYEGVVFNMADKMVIRAIANASQKEIQEVTALYKQKGDLGIVAESLSKNRNSGNNLSILEVFEALWKLAKDSGEDSQERKLLSLSALLKNLDSLSNKYVVRIVLGKLRLGFSDKTIIDAISWMETGDKGQNKILEKAYEVLPDVGLLAEKVKEKGSLAIKNINPVVGIPVLPMLAQRIKSPQEMISKMGGEVSIEPKLDGLRILIHYKKGGSGFVKAYTRNLNENSWMFPELNKISDFVKADSLILDGEAVGLDESTKQMANFQVTMTRRRKHEIEETLSKVGIKFYVFDILSRNNLNLMDKPYEERRKILEDTIKNNGPFEIVNYEITNDPQKISELYLKERKKGLEGIVVKNINSTYVPGRTGWRWVKMKQEEGSTAKLLDTIDAVVMGYSKGKGKRSDFGLGQFLVGVYDPKEEKYKTITKVGTGLTDELFKNLKTRLTKLEVKDMPLDFDVHKNYIPDNWVEPSLVVEIAGDDITKSPTHTAGYALRFPRLVRFRDDKTPHEATTLSEYKEMFNSQS